jgi:membrane protein YdbS with pleckstrin-like domain
MESPQPLKPPSVADGVEHSLDSRSIDVNRISAAVFFGILLLIAFAGAVVAAIAASGPVWARLLLPFAAVPLLGVAFAWFVYSWPLVAHRHTSYRLDEDGIAIRRGVFWRHAIDVPRNRVQHTDVSQGPVERNFGLGTLVIFTAGTEHARVTLGGLDHGVALRVRDHLLATGRDDAV